MTQSLKFLKLTENERRILVIFHICLGSTNKAELWDSHDNGDCLSCRPPFQSSILAKGEVDF